MDFSMETQSMDFIHRVGEYRTLVGKRDQLGYPLGSLEQARLDELEAFFARQVDPDRLPYASRERAREAISLVVTFSSGSDPAHGEARNVSPEGMFIATWDPPPIGTRTVVRVIDRTTGEEWRFGAEVVRLAVGPLGGIGLRFKGIPLRLRLGHRKPAPHGEPRLKHAA
jgi:hypothetical protein